MHGPRLRLHTSHFSTNLRSASRASHICFKDVLLKVAEQVAFKDTCVMRALADGGVWFQRRDVYFTAHRRQRALEPSSASS